MMWKVLVCVMVMAGTAVAEAPQLRMVSHDRLYHGERRVELDEFLRIGGRDDLARRVERRQLLRRGLYLTGGLVLIGGLVAYASAPDCSGRLTSLDRQDCERDRSHRHLLGLGISGGGIAIATFGMVLSPLRPPMYELQGVARDYNRSIAVTPVIGRDGGGLSLHGRF